MLKRYYKRLKKILLKPIYFWQFKLLIAILMTLIFIVLQNKNKNIRLEFNDFLTAFSKQKKCLVTLSKYSLFNFISYYTRHKKKSKILTMKLFSLNNNSIGISLYLCTMYNVYLFVIKSFWIIVPYQIDRGRTCYV